MRLRPSLLMFAVVVAAYSFSMAQRRPAAAFPHPHNTRSDKPETKMSPPKPGTEAAVKAFMRQKLQAMRLVLRGIVTEDYPLILNSARAMKKMGTATDWNIVQGNIYGDHSAAFLRSVDLLEKAARSKNADGATLVYMQMTMNCIECHRYVREPGVRRKICYQ